MSVSSDDADTIVPHDSSSISSHSPTTTFDFESVSIDSNSSASAVLENFSKYICLFLYDEAKAIVDKQLSQKNMDSQWVFLLQMAGNITLVEKQYMNLSFLAPKGFLRKESNLRSSFENLRQDLLKFKATDFVSYASELLYLVSVRIDQMDFYEKLSLLGTAKNVEIDDLITEFEIITEKYGERKKLVAGVRLGFPHIFACIGWEIEALSQLLKSHSSMQSWDFFSSVVTSQEGQKRLSEWAEFLQLHQSSRKSSFLNSGPVSPSLYRWLASLRTALLSKFSLYFYEILAKYSNPGFDVKMVAGKLQPDYVAKISSFVKKSDASCICLIFDAKGIPYHPNGYSFPTRTQEPPTGINTFPAVLAIPSKPTSNWPGVVMLINDRIPELSADKMVGFFDAQVQTTYFLYKVDVHMYMLAVYDSKKSEKDSYVAKFMSEMAADLKCGRIFASLRTIAK